MTGALLLLPAPLSDASLDAVLPAATIASARATRFFLAENAKSTRAFLKKLDHPQPLRELSIVEIGHRPDVIHIDEWLAPTRQGHDVAVVAEAGCPGIADPGATIVAAAHRVGIRVRPLTGPSAIVLALMASGLEGQRFRFVGYLPVEAAARTAAIRALEHESRGRSETQIIIETPYRSATLLKALVEHCAPKTRIGVACELTGADEFVLTLATAAWRQRAQAAAEACSGRPTVFCVQAEPAVSGGTSGRA